MLVEFSCFSTVTWGFDVRKKNAPKWSSCCPRRWKLTVNNYRKNEDGIIYLLFLDCLEVDDWPGSMYESMVKR